MRSRLRGEALLFVVARTAAAACVVALLACASSGVARADIMAPDVSPCTLLPEGARCFDHDVVAGFCVHDHDGSKVCRAGAARRPAAVPSSSARAASDPQPAPAPDAAPAAASSAAVDAAAAPAALPAPPTSAAPPAPAPTPSHGCSAAGGEPGGSWLLAVGAAALAVVVRARRSGAIGRTARREESS